MKESEIAAAAVKSKQNIEKGER